MILSSIVNSLVVAAGAAHHGGGEASLVLPEGIAGNPLLLGGLVVCAAGLLFGLVVAKQLKALPVHKSMLEISELIYETAKTYLVTQGKFIALLWAFIAVIVGVYYGFLTTGPDGTPGLGAARVAIILVFSLVGILGSSGVAWFGI